MAVALALALSALVTQSDPYGLGDGHDGPLVISSGFNNLVNHGSQLVTPINPGETSVVASEPTSFLAGDLVMIGTRAVSRLRRPRR
jgi:hypothetical protein